MVLALKKNNILWEIDIFLKSKTVCPYCTSILPISVGEEWNEEYSVLLGTCVNSALPRNRCQDKICHARDFLEEMPVKK